MPALRPRRGSAAPAVDQPVGSCRLTCPVAASVARDRRSPGSGSAPEHCTVVLLTTAYFLLLGGTRQDRRDLLAPRACSSPHSGLGATTTQPVPDTLTDAWLTVQVLMVLLKIAGGLDVSVVAGEACGPNRH